MFDTIMKQRLVPENLFAFYLTSIKDKEKGQFSEITFGYYDKSKFEGEIHWSPIN